MTSLSELAERVEALAREADTRLLGFGRAVGELAGTVANLQADVKLIAEATAALLRAADQKGEG